MELYFLQNLHDSVSRDEAATDEQLSRYYFDPRKNLILRVWFWKDQFSENCYKPVSRTFTLRPVNKCA